MSDKSVAEKLGYKGGHAVHVINAPGDYSEVIGPLPEGVELVEEGPADAVHLFVAGSAELDRHAEQAIEALRPGGLLWISYPKGGASDINRDSLWPLLTPYGLRPVRQISIDARWSALRFRPEADVRPAAGGKR